MLNWEMIYNQDGDLVGHVLDGVFYYPEEFEARFKEDEKK